MEKVCARNVCKEHTESNRQKEQRLKAFDYCKIYKRADYNVHYKCFEEKPWVVLEQKVQTGGLPYFNEKIGQECSPPF